MIPHSNKTYSSATIFTLIFSVVAAFIVPFGYFIISYEYLKGIMETEAEINSQTISSLISTNPELWRYETIRIEELLARRPRSGAAETRRIYDINNILVAESVNFLTAPKITATHDVKDSGETVGRIEISRSLQPILLQTAVLGIFGIGFGLLLYRWLPFQALIRAGDKLQEANDFLKKVMEGSTNSLVVLELNGTIKMFNAQFEALSGFSAEDLQGRHFNTLFSGASLTQVSTEFGKVTDDGLQRVLFETDFLRPDGLELRLFCGAVPLMSKGVINCLVVSLEDITDRITAEEERLELERNLLQTQKLESLGVLAGGIAHDFNNILTIILGYCLIFKDEVSSDSTQAMYLEKIEEASNRAADLCQQMLTYAGRQEILHVQINLTSLVEDIAKMLHSGIKKNVKLEVDHANILLIVADSSQIQQVVMNLFINAAEAIGDHNGTIRISLKKIEVLAEQPEIDFSGKAIRAGQYVCLEVSDNGCGMDEATQIRIFEPFYTTKFTGRGLGMSATLGIIKSHDGALQLSTAPGTGTTFKVYLPLATEVTLSKDMPSESQIIPSKSGNTILLIDDEYELRVLGSIRLHNIGYLPITAANGLEALTIFKEQQNEIDLILLDLIMPEMDGVETYHRLREISKTIPIVFCSGCSKSELSIDILNDAHTDFIKKPYKPVQLRSVLHEMLG
jgi:two-component system cell cycle sensor histidine kinase/response regulator CckA